MATVDNGAVHILFVCMAGNICRSRAPNAWPPRSAMRTRSRSSGRPAQGPAVIGHPCSPGCRPRPGGPWGDAAGFAARQLTANIANDADLVIAMTRRTGTPSSNSPRGSCTGPSPSLRPPSWSPSSIPPTLKTRHAALKAASRTITRCPGPHRAGSGVLRSGRLTDRRTGAADHRVLPGRLQSVIPAPRPESI